jgi:hypothetical protein
MIAAEFALGYLFRESGFFSLRGIDRHLSFKIFDYMEKQVYNRNVKIM